MGRQSVEERFSSKVDRRGPGECWPWKAVKDKDGYGLFSVGGRMSLAHRIAWELTNGPIPEGKQALHRCDTRSCCNPACLFLGTHDENMRDMVKKGRQAKGDRNGARLHPEKVARGERNGRAKLTEAVVRSIRARFEAGCETKATLAREFGVSHVLVGMIVRREVWKHLPDLDTAERQLSLPFAA